VFTGIVEELGEVVDVVDLPDDARRVTIVAPIVLTDASLGDSIAVNGVCLTVAELGDRTFTADVMRETLQRSSLRDVAPGARVNLERPVTLATRLGGHLVQGHVDLGHVDLVGEVVSPAPDLRIRIARNQMHLLVEKGSITVDGVSLTVAGVGHDERGHWFSVSLIPTTLEVTNLGRREVGDVVNLEVDVIAKYVERLSEFGARS